MSILVLLNNLYFLLAFPESIDDNECSSSGHCNNNDWNQNEIFRKEVKQTLD